MDMDMDMDMVDMDMDMDMERSTMYCTRVQHVKQEPTSMVHVHVKEPDGAQHTYWCKPASPTSSDAPRPVPGSRPLLHLWAFQKPRAQH